VELVLIDVFEQFERLLMLLLVSMVDSQELPLEFEF
jgi:hypothetical protein